MINPPDGRLEVLKVSTIFYFSKDADGEYRVGHYTAGEFPGDDPTPSEEETLLAYVRAATLNPKTPIPAPLYDLLLKQGRAIADARVAPWDGDYEE